MTNNIILEKKSKVHWVSNKKESVSVVIPKTVRELMNIKPGNSIKWTITFKNNKPILTVEAEETENEKEGS